MPPMTMSECVLLVVIANHDAEFEHKTQYYARRSSVGSVATMATVPLTLMLPSARENASKCTSNLLCEFGISTMQQ